MENLKELLEEFIDWARDCGRKYGMFLTIRKKLLRNFSDNERNSLLITLSVWSFEALKYRIDTGLN
jgi:hypothetical protein